MEKRDFEGTNIGNYRIKSIIGRGAFSDVYLASHVILTERVVAIKLLHSHLSEREYEHFLQEARLLERLRHPNILPILDAGIFESSAYLITEYAPGGSLRDLLKYTARERLPIEDTLKILTQIGDALEYAHEHKVIHRDVKPENILFNSERDVLLADFGIAVVQAQETTGEVIGTPSYMAPEQFAGKVSRKSDQYALGCIAYELLTGQRPFTGPSMQSIMARHLFEMPPPLHQLVRSIPIAIEQIVLKSLAKDPKGRFNSVSEFISTLQGATQSLTSVPETSSETSGPPTSTPDTSSETPTSRTSIPETSETPAAQPPQPPSSTILLPTPRRSPDDLKDFFIMSHNTDRFWGEWIAGQLEKANYTVIFPAWDFRPGTDFNLETQKALVAAKYIIAVLSPDYIALRKNQEARTVAFQTYTTREQKRLIPIQVRECGAKLQKFLGSMVYIDLVGYDEKDACTVLLSHIQAVVDHKPIRPSSPPPFPGKEKVFPTASPPFPFSQSNSGITFVQREIPLIETAFRKKSWSDVIIRTSALIEQNASTTLPPEIYHRQGQALSEVGESERARKALEMALTLVHDETQRLLFLHDYVRVLATLGRWREILAHTNKALQLAPNDPDWLEHQQRASIQVAKSTLEPRSTLVTLSSNANHLSTSQMPIIPIAQRNPNISPSPIEKHIVLLVHGIRTHASWQERVAVNLEEQGVIKIIPLRYGYLNLLQFWFPFFTRKQAIDRVYRDIREALYIYPDSNLSIMAHSFGTYAITKILEDHPDIHIYRLILCGSILKEDFRWDRVRPQIEGGQRGMTGVINECGTRDIWPVLARISTWGYGDVGTFGVGTSSKVDDRYHDCGHGDYFSPEFVKKFWVPFIKDGQFIRSEWDITRPTQSWWMSCSSIVPSGCFIWLILILVILLFIFPR